ncbi:hypothetical protein SAY86_011580 [Trapa natans]|uniref:Uncharacterized protein n=1 Tax=Trapa natans TaxID=22666 RepID=A0AAN7LXA3_TRANT|nr:hypothetical protein SAY86_011580 [Trapa natans]
MARSNKYTSINFNDIYEKQISSSATKPGSSRPSTASSLSSYSAASSSNGATSNYKSHLTQGRMLVLTRPTPKPIAVPPLSPSAVPVSDQAQNLPVSDPISLRPLGRTGPSSPLPSPAPVLESDREVLPPITSPKPDRFVPPHLRPGFAGKEERPEVPKQVGSRARETVQRQQQQQQQQQQQRPYGSPSYGQYIEDQLRRPKSGGYDRMRRGGESEMIRGSSFGSRPSSSG